MHLTKEDIQSLEQLTRVKIINSITGIKPANLIGTRSNQGVSNLAIFSSVVHLGSNPALIGFVMRPHRDTPRHTFNNIMSEKYYTINHIHPTFIENAHATSARYSEDISEFDACKLTEEYLDDFAAPYVGESQIKMGLEYKMTLDIPLNGTSLLVGEIQHLYLPENVNFEQEMNLEAMDSVGISGLNSYYKLTKLDEFPYARVAKT